MDFEELLKRRNSKNSFGRLAGVKGLEIGDGWSRAMAEVTENSMNPVGSIHGGLLMTLADVACGGAASSRGNTVVTVNSNFHFLRRGTENMTALYAEARECKRGRRLLVFNVTVSDQEGTELVQGTVTYMILD